MRILIIALVMLVFTSCVKEEADECQCGILQKPSSSSTSIRKHHLVSVDYTHIYDKIIENISFSIYRINVATNYEDDLFKIIYYTFYETNCGDLMLLSSYPKGYKGNISYKKMIRFYDSDRVRLTHKEGDKYCRYY